MKITTIVIRILLGLLLMFSAVVYFFKLVPTPELQGPLKVFNDGMAAAVYLLPLIKTTELICAVAFLSGRFVPLATVVIFPITVNIIMVHSFLAPEGLPVAIFVILANLFLAYIHRKNYETLIASK